MLMVLFLAKHAAVLFVVLAAAWGAGTLVAGGREPLALRCALGLAVWAEAMFALAAVGKLRPALILFLLVIAIAGGALRARWPVSVSKGWVIAFVAVGLPAFLLALQPPLAFDETLYHLPFVRAFARNGALRFLGELRFPAFPQLHELLCVPVYLLAGDTATHLVSLVEIMVTAALLGEWGRRYTPRAGALAAALFVGSPIVTQLATFLYVDAALTLFVAAGFYALDVALTESPASGERETGNGGLLPNPASVPRGPFTVYRSRRPLLFSGLFFGVACSVKYLGGFFAFAALLIVIIVRRRDAPLFALATAAAALPTTVWLLIATANPFFPFAPSLFGRNLWTMSAESHIAFDMPRVLWDVTFARERVNAQPPVTPLLIGMVALLAVAAFRHWRARVVLIMAGAYLVAFTFMPQDSRYLVPLLPLVSVCVAVIVATRFPRLTAVATIVGIAPGVAYLVWRLASAGLPPADASSRHAVIAGRTAGYEALTRAGASRVYVCGAEQLQYYAAGPLLGDFTGLHSYARVLDGASDTATLAARLRNLDVAYYLSIKKRCASRTMTGGLELAYEDDGAQLWRVLR